MIALNQKGKTVFTSAALSRTLKAASISTIPAFGGDVSRPFYLASGPTTAELGLYDTGAQRWNKATIPSSLGNTVGVTTGNQGGKYRWIGALAKDGRFSVIRLNFDLTISSVETIASVSPLAGEKLLQ